jgi:adenosine deaminase
MGGSVYAEDFMRWAGEKGLCIDAATLAFAQPPCAPGFPRRRSPKSSLSSSPA